MARLPLQRSVIHETTELNLVCLYEIPIMHALYIHTHIIFAISLSYDNPIFTCGQTLKQIRSKEFLNFSQLLAGLQRVHDVCIRSSNLASSDDHCCETSSKEIDSYHGYWSFGSHLRIEAISTLKTLEPNNRCKDAKTFLNL